jgi:multidrug efflux pump subunit AcrB
MNLAEYSIRNSVVTWIVAIVLVGVGTLSFQSLSRLEDPEFTIKDAIIFTPYPGASATEVEEEVTNVIEKAAQEMGQLKRVESRSSRGMSYIKVSMKDKYDKAVLPQVWDELRRKVGDARRFLPPGAGPSLVNDDFGDVYGAYVAITGEGYTYKEIYEYAKFLQRELLQVKDVKRVAVIANRNEVIYVEMRRSKIVELGVSPDELLQALSSKNLVSSSGQAVLGTESVALNPTGEFTSETQFGDLLIRGSKSGSNRLVYLRDIADISRGYEDPPTKILRYNGVRSVGLGISTVLGGNVVVMGEGVDQRLAELKGQAPLGMDLNVISLQSRAVAQSINGFLINLGEAVLIVILVLMLFMGLRSAGIIGAILLITIMGSFIIMKMQGIILERISLGALVIALGMLVDNAIVVTDGMRMKMQKGIDGMTAAKDVVGQTAIPLLGATIVAVAAFAAIGLSPDNTGEYCRSLFSVILISLMMSWFTAVTITPLFCATFLKVGPAGSGDEEKDPYDGAFFRYYKRALELCLRRRWLTVGAVVLLFVTSLVGFGMLKQSFFPDSTRPQFTVDFWFPEGIRIEETEINMARAEEFLLGLEGVQNVATSVGGGHSRFLLTYTGEKSWEGYAQTLVTVDNYRGITDLIREVEQAMPEMFPEAIVAGQKFMNGPGEPGQIRVRIIGPDAEVLRTLAAKAERIFDDHPDTKSVRNDWRSRVKVLRPQMAEAQSRNAGIERPQLARALETAIDGVQAGVYREGDELIPIVARSPESERFDLGNLNAVQIWSPAAQSMIPMGQVVTGFETEFEDAYVWRRHRTRTITVFADPSRGLASEVFKDFKVEVEQALGVDLAALGINPSNHTFKSIKVEDDGKLPLADMPGYYIAWGGQAEDSARAQAGLIGNFPPILGIMIFVVIWLFNSVRKTAIIWLCVPLALIGVSLGLLVTSQPFGFMALLGLLSLMGMLIKNAIVLIDQIGIETDAGKSTYQAIVDSGVSRMIPVMMAAATTILGMAPLLQDAFFISMAVTIMFGLGFATILTLLVVPVFYSIFYKAELPARE